MAGSIQLTDESFETEVLQSGMPVLVDFSTAWCGPCKVIAPMVEELAAEYEGRAKICKISAEIHQKPAVEFGVRSFPTILIFKNGKVVDNIIGAVPKSQIENRLKSHI